MSRKNDPKRADAAVEPQSSDAAVEPQSAPQAPPFVAPLSATYSRPARSILSTWS